MRRALGLVPAWSHLDWRLSKVLKSIGLPYVQLHGCSDLPKARSRLLSDAMRTPAEVFVLIDSDMVPTPEHFDRLVNSEKLDASNAISGCYLVGTGDRVAAAADAPLEVTIGGDTRYVDVAFAGAGFAAVDRRSVEMLDQGLPLVRDPQGDTWRPYFVPFLLDQGPEAGGEHIYVPEDYSFWWRLKAIAKTQLWLDTSVAVGHAKLSVLVPKGRVKTLGDDVQNAPSSDLPWRDLDYAWVNRSTGP
jgi:hypothetical protein